MQSVRIRSLLRLIVIVAFLIAGSAHFLRPNIFIRIVPPMFPHPRLLVQISGVCEIAGAVGLLELLSVFAPARPMTIPMTQPRKPFESSGFGGALVSATSTSPFGST